jgi:SAM-dependent methyltransferase
MIRAVASDSSGSQMTVAELVTTAYVEHGSAVLAVAAAYVAGLATTAFVASCWFDAVVDRVTFDRRHNVDTASPGTVFHFALRRHSRRYSPPAARTVRSILTALQDEIRNFDFIDVGSGKGRALLIASEYPFHKIVGIERAHELVEISRQNLRRYRADGRQCVDVEVREMDARDFEIPDRDCVLFLQNPFGPPLLAEKIRQSCATRQRELYIVYFNPWRSAVFDAMPCLRRVAPPSANTDHFAVYRRVPGAATTPSDQGLMAA